MKLLSQLLEQRSALHAELKALLETVETEQRSDLTEDERTAFDTKRSALDALDTKIDELEDIAKREARHAEIVKRYAPTGPVATITNEARTYSPQSPNSFVADIMAVRRGDNEARERLERHTLEERSLTTAPFDTNGVAAGAYIVPTFLQDNALQVNRARSVYADGVTNLALPGGVSSFQVPRLHANGTLADVQAGELQPLVEGSLSTDMVPASVVTVGGSQVVSLQALTQSPVQWDTIVLRELGAVTAARINQAVLSASIGDGTNGTATYVDAPGTTIGEVFAAIVGAASRITTNRFDQASRIVMHPRRWAFLVSATDTTGRPLVNAYSPQNAIGTGGIAIGGPVGELAGLNVYVDPFVPVDVAGRDIVIVEKSDDIINWRSPIFTRAIDSTEWANSLGVLFQAYAFTATTAARTATRDAGTGRWVNSTSTVALRLTGLPA